MRQYSEEFREQSVRKMMLNLAEAQRRAGSPDQSISTFEAWLEKNLTDLDVRYRLANTHLLLNLPEQAKKAYAAVVLQRPRDTAALNNLAWLLRNEDPDKSLDYAERALASDPDSPAVMDTLGVVLLEQGKTKRALRVLEDAAASAPRHKQTRYHYAQALVRHGDYTRARTVLERLLTEEGPFPQEAEARLLLLSLGE